MFLSLVFTCCFMWWWNLTKQWHALSYYAYCNWHYLFSSLPPIITWPRFTCLYLIWVGGLALLVMRTMTSSEYTCHSRHILIYPLYIVGLCCGHSWPSDHSQAHGSNILVTTDWAYNSVPLCGSFLPSFTWLQCPQDDDPSLTVCLP